MIATRRVVGFWCAYNDPTTYPELLDPAARPINSRKRRDRLDASE
jgi:hypothetical protein